MKSAGLVGAVARIARFGPNKVMEQDLDKH